MLTEEARPLIRQYLLDMFTAKELLHIVSNPMEADSVADALIAQGIRVDHFFEIQIIAEQIVEAQMAGGVEVRH